MGQQIAPLRTKLTPQDAANWLVTAWDEQRPPTSARKEPLPPLTGDVLALLLALWDLETGTGKSMWHWNYGNIVHVPQNSRDWYVLPGDGSHTYNAFRDPLDGAQGLNTQLTRDSRKQWRNGLLTGDPTVFVDSLHGKYGGPAYFEANRDRYLKGFLSRWQSYRHLGGTPRTDLPSESQTAPVGSKRPSGSGWLLMVLPLLVALVATNGARL